MREKIEEVVTLMRERKFDHNRNELRTNEVNMVFSRFYQDIGPTGMFIWASVILRVNREIGDSKMELSFSGNLFNLTSRKFSLMHPDFNRFLKAIRIYAKRLKKPIKL